MKPITRILLAQHLALGTDDTRPSIVGLLTGVPDLDGASLSDIVRTDALLAAVDDDEGEMDGKGATAHALAQKATHLQPWSTVGWSALAAQET